jgi:hypothetical protein
MKPTQRNRDEFVRHRDDLNDLDFYRRATELRVQTMRDNKATLKSAFVGLLLILAFPVAFATTASLLRGSSHTTAAQTAPVLTR